MQLNEFIKSPAVTCDLASTLSEAAHLMRLRGVGSLVVLDGGGAITGILTDRDLALKGYGKGLAASATVDEVMSTSPKTIAFDADSSEATTKMIEFGVRRLPVVDATGALCGIVTFDDLVLLVEHEVETLRRALEGQLVADSPSWTRSWDT
jgi:CBS domain-containing protein